MAVDWTRTAAIDRASSRGRRKDLMLKSASLIVAALAASGCSRIQIDEPAAAAEAALVAMGPSISAEARKRVELRRPVAAIKRAVIISTDGLRPDLALRASIQR